MSFAAELRTLWHLARGSRAAASHAARLEAFYRPQAAHYDRFTFAQSFGDDHG